MIKPKILLILCAPAILASCGGVSTASSTPGGSSSSTTSIVVESSEGKSSGDASRDSSASAGEKYLFYELNEGVQSSEMEGSPWVNTILEGRAAKVKKPSKKDDFYLSTTYDTQVAAKLGPDDLAIGGLPGAIKSISKNTTKILTEKTSSKFSDTLTKSYSLYMKADKSEDVAHVKKNIDAIKAITSVSDFVDYCVGGGYDLSWPLFQIVKYVDNTILLKEENMGLSPNAIYFAYNDAEEPEKKTRVEQSSEYLLSLYGYNSADAKALTEKALAAMGKCLNGGSQLQTSVAEIDERYPSLKLKSYFTRLGYAESTKIMATSAIECFFKSFYDGSLTLDELKAMLIYRYAFASVYTRPFADENGFAALTEGLNSNARGYSQDMLLKSIFDQRLQQIYDRAYLDTFETAERRENIIQLEKDVVNEYVSLLGECDWLEKATKDEAIAKVKAMKFDCCYPEDLTKLPDLDLSSSVSFAELLDKYTAWTRGSNQPERAGYQLWNDATITTPNAVYSPDSNSFVVFDGILAGEGYSLNMGKEQLYGSIGQVIGHEISHAFDVGGSQIDKDGFTRDWWTEKDKEAFSSKVARIKAVWSTYTNKKDMPLQCHDAMLSEIIADMGGMSVTLRLGRKQTGFDFAKYFEAYADSMGTVLSQQLLENMVYGGGSLMQDSHPLSQFRVNGVVNQFAEFYTTFDVKEGDHMYVEEAKRLNIWG